MLNVKAISAMPKNLVGFYCLKRMPFDRLCALGILGFTLLGLPCVVYSFT